MYVYIYTCIYIIYIYTCIYIIYIYVCIYTYIFENIFPLMSLSIFYHNILSPAENNITENITEKTIQL